MAQDDSLGTGILHLQLHGNGFFSAQVKDIPPSLMPHISSEERDIVSQILAMLARDADVFAHRTSLYTQANMGQAITIAGGSGSAINTVAEMKKTRDFITEMARMALHRLNDASIQHNKLLVQATHTTDANAAKGILSTLAKSKFLRRSIIGLAVGGSLLVTSPKSNAQSDAYTSQIALIQVNFKVCESDYSQLISIKNAALKLEQSKSKAYGTDIPGINDEIKKLNESQDRYYAEGTSRYNTARDAMDKLIHSITMKRILGMEDIVALENCIYLAEEFAKYLESIGGNHLRQDNEYRQFANEVKSIVDLREGIGPKVDALNGMYDLNKESATDSSIVARLKTVLKDKASRQNMISRVAEVMNAANHSDRYGPIARYIAFQSINPLMAYLNKAMVEADAQYRSTGNVEYLELEHSVLDVLKEIAERDMGLSGSLTTVWDHHNKLGPIYDAGMSIYLKKTISEIKNAADFSKVIALFKDYYTNHYYGLNAKEQIKDVVIIFMRAQARMLASTDPSFNAAQQQEVGKAINSLGGM